MVLINLLMMASKSYIWQARGPEHLQQHRIMSGKWRYEGWRLSHGNYFFGTIDRSWRNMEIYKWKWMVLGSVICMNNAGFIKKRANDILHIGPFFDYTENPEHILYECTKYNSIRDRLRERALIEGVAWPPQLDFWMRTWAGRGDWDWKKSHSTENCRYS